MKTATPLVLGLALTLTLSVPATGTVIYDEARDGDLSDVAASPTALALGAGSNRIVGTAGVGLSDVDFFTLSLGAGLRLDGLFLDGYAGSNLSFIAVQPGDEWTEDVGGATAIDPANLLGWTHFGPGDVGNDILASLGSGAGASGFSPPLGSGVYTFLVQETAPVSIHYAFDFQVTPVPEPPLWALLGVGVVLLARRLRAAPR